MVLNIFLGLGIFIALLMVLAFIQTRIQKKRGTYEMGSSSESTRTTNPKVHHEKKVKAWPIFDNIKTYLIHRTAFFKNRKDRAKHAASMTDYKKRSRAFKALAKESFRYSWAAPYTSKKLA